MAQLKRLALAGACTVALVTMVAVAAASGSGTTVKAVGKATFKPNVGVTDTQHWSPGPVSVASGGQITWKNASKTGDPHTITIVAKKDLPKGFDCPACDQALKRHGANQQTGQVKHPVVNAGAAGLDVPGDSLFLPPHGKVSARVTAPAGTTLYYVCAIHPWMQGRIHVHA